MKSRRIASWADPDTGVLDRIRRLSSASSRQARTRTFPLSVNLTAFPSTFMRTWRSRAGSNGSSEARREGPPGARAPLVASECTASTASRTGVEDPPRDTASWKRPAATLARSRRSLMSEEVLRALVGFDARTPGAPRRIRGALLDQRREPDHRVERRAELVRRVGEEFVLGLLRLLELAITRWSSSFRRWSSSVRLVSSASRSRRSVTSRPTRTSAFRWPCRSRVGERRTSAGKRDPSARRNPISLRTRSRRSARRKRPRPRSGRDPRARSSRLPRERSRPRAEGALGGGVRVGHGPRVEPEQDLAGAHVKTRGAGPGVRAGAA